MIENKHLVTQQSVLRIRQHGSQHAVTVFRPACGAWRSQLQKWNRLSNRKVKMVMHFLYKDVMKMKEEFLWIFGIWRFFRWLLLKRVFQKQQIWDTRCRSFSMWFWLRQSLQSYSWYIYISVLWARFLEKRNKLKINKWNLQFVRKWKTSRVDEYPRELL